MSTSCCEPVPEACCSLEISEPDQQRLVEMFKALGNPLRFEILKFLVTHPGCITGDIVDHLPIAQATVSQHLKVLRDAGWIVGTVDGPARCYCLNAENIAWFRTQVAAIF
jgi:predicted transcriptional regulator